MDNLVAVVVVDNPHTAVEEDMEVAAPIHPEDNPDSEDMTFYSSGDNLGDVAHAQEST